ncbi:MAG: translation initiation factor IF-2 [bacterium]
MRVFELAQTLATTSSDVLRQAGELGLEARSPLARLDEDEVKQLQSHFCRRTKEEIDREAEERRVKLSAKREADRLRQASQLKAERDVLLANIARAREIERLVNGTPVEAAPTTPAPAPAPTAAPVATATPDAPAAPAAATPPAAAAAAPKPAAPKPGAPVAAVPVPVVPAAAVKPRLDKPRPKGPRRPGSEEEIDPDEALVAAYVGPQAVRPVSRGADKPRPGKDVEAPRGSRQAPPRGGGAPTRFVLAQRAAAAAAPAAPAAAEPANDHVLMVRGPVVVKELAEMLGLRPNRLIADLMQLNVLASINQRVEIELANRIASKYGYTVEIERARRSTERKPVLRRDDADDDIPDDRPEELVPRPPVVTFLGHVDHGKTSLMDRIRNATVAAGESGGITQHIGAYTVDVNGRKITFLDTPGHAAFSAMRARGASLTDIAVIIIAADDGIMPQTKEAIRHAKQAGVQLLIAINKCDLPQAKPERVKQQLQGEGLTPEDWGGDVVCCEVSAITGKGVDHLLEMILLQADVLELTANISRRASGFVIEAQLEQGRGPTATLLVSGGTLNVGDVVLCGDYFGRIRALMDDRGRMVKSATPATAVKCMGLSGVPEAGSPFRVMLDEKRARDLAETFADERKRGELATSKVTSLDALMSQIKDQNRLELNIIVKADTQGSVEAIVDSLKEIKSEKVTLNIINSNIGNVTANDVQRANAGRALIIGFHIACESGVQSMARHDGVRVQTFRIIYELIDRVKQEMLDLLAPEYREVLRGHAMLKTVFDLSRKGKIAGCQVSDGVVRTDAKVRVYRQRQIVYNGRIATLRHFQSEVSEVKEPQECGIRFENFDSFAEGDYIECYILEELPRTL